MIPEKQDNCPVCGEVLSQAQYDLQSHMDHWLLGEIFKSKGDTKMNEDEFRGQPQGTDENNKLRALCGVAWGILYDLTRNTKIIHLDGRSVDYINTVVDILDNASKGEPVPAIEPQDLYFYKPVEMTKSEFKNVSRERLFEEYAKITLAAILRQPEARKIPVAKTVSRLAAQLVIEHEERVGELTQTQ